MKLFATIIAIIIFGLSVTPCADKGACSKLQNQQVVNHEHDQEEQEHHPDHCSPLCVCSCCNTVTTHFEFKLLEEFEFFEFVKSYETEFKSPIVSTPHYPIWQPPQLV